MKQSKKITKIASLEKLEYIRENVSRDVNEERVKAAVFSVKKESLQKLLRLFSGMNNTFVEEGDNLREKSHGYNSKYATPYNHLFSCAYNVLDTIKKQVFFLFRIMNAVSNKPNQKQASLYGDTNCIAFDVSHSLIGNQPYTPYMFDIRTEQQDRLITEITAFLHYLDNNLELCINVIEEEKTKGNNIDELLYIFESQIDEVYEYVKDRCKSVNSQADYYTPLVNYTDNPEVLKDWFHELTPNQFTDVTLGIKKSTLNRYSEKQRKAFKDDERKLSKFKKVMEHIDDIVDAGTISGELLAFVHMYTNCTSSNAAFHSAFCETYSSMGGKRKIVSPARLGQAFKTVDYSRYNDFTQKMDGFI